MPTVVNDRAHHVLGVLHAIHVADLVAVEGRNRHLFDAKAARLELNDDLRVEVEVVRVLLEGKMSERGHREGAIAGVELGQVHAEHRVFGPRQNAIADELIQGHAAFAGRALVHHARAEHGVRFPGDERREQVVHSLGGVLSVPV